MQNYKTDPNLHADEVYHIWNRLKWKYWKIKLKS
jgi:hypothetical protein